MQNFLSKKARSVTPYTAGEQPSDRQYVKLNTNENPYPPSPKALEAYRRYDFSTLNLYPPLAMQGLRQAIAAAEGVLPEQVFCGNGSDEILALCFAAFFDADGDGAAFADITYSFYPVFADFFSIPHTVVPLEEDFTQDLGKLSETRAQGLLVANPNAPTGIGIPRAEIEVFVRRNAYRTVIIDEAYMPFYNESAVPLVHSHQNLLVVKTFSKGYSLAGMRCGYAVGSPALIDGLERCRDCFNSYPRRPHLPGGVRRRHCRRRLLSREERARRLRARAADAGTCKTRFFCAAFQGELRVRAARGGLRPRRVRRAEGAGRAGAPLPKAAHRRILPHHHRQPRPKRRPLAALDELLDECKM